MDKLGIAIIGTGAVAPAHAEAYRDNPACELKVFCNTHAAKAEKLAASLGVQVDVVSDYKEVLARDDVDAVSVCLPPALHKQVTCDALLAGKHVLVEKPMAPSLEECDAMIRAARESGKLLSVVSNNRFKTSAMKVKRLLDEKAGGKLLFTTVNSLWWRGGNYYDLSWRGTWERECGGCTTSHAVHHIDLMQWMIGMPQTVTAVMGNVGHDNSECEDYAVAVCTYPDMVAQFSANIVSHGEEQELVFQTEKARLSVPWSPVAYQALSNGFPQDNDAALAELKARYDALPELTLEGHAGQIDDFVQAILGNGQVLVDGQQGRNAIELIMAIYKSAATHQTVTLPIAEDDPFYRRETMTAQMPRYHKKYRFVDAVENAPPISFGRDLGK